MRVKCPKAGYDNKIQFDFALRARRRLD